MKENEPLSIKLAKSIGIEVKNARLKTGQAIEEFSRNCKINSGTLQYIENATGEGDLDIYPLFCICKYLGIELKAFFERIENRMDTL